MKIENPLAYSFIMPDELYLLNADKVAFSMLSMVETIVEIETPPLNFNYLGGHKKNFLVVVHYPGIEFIDEKHLTALENILKGLKLSLEDAAIVNLAVYPDTVFEHLTEFFKPQKLVLLGKSALPSGIDTLTRNQLKKLGDCNTLYSFSFAEMMDNVENKKIFWEQMKQL